MGRTKKKMSVAAPTEVIESTARENPPIQRKRGRPRKVVIETVKIEEPESTEGKKQKTSEESGNKNSSQEVEIDISEAGLGKTDTTTNGTSNEEPSKPTAVKREGSRRKSEPRRAAESFIEGR